MGASTLVLTDGAVTLDAANITLTGKVAINGPLTVSADILGGARIIDTAGNTPNHKH